MCHYSLVASLQKFHSFQGFLETLPLVEVEVVHYLLQQVEEEVENTHYLYYYLLVALVGEEE